MRSGRRGVPAFVVLALALGLSLAGWQLARSYVRSEAEAALEANAVQLETELADRIDAYAQVLRGGAALFALGGEPTREQWRVYAKSLALDEHLPGIQGFGYAKQLAPEELDAHVAAVRAEGFPDYDVRPRDPPREVYTSIVYLEPFEGRNLRAFGFDMFSEATRREAMMRARDTGDPALSGRVTLVQENGTDVQQGFLLYFPVYAPGSPTSTVEERRASLLGYVYSPFRAGDFVQGLEVDAAPEVHLSVYDGLEAREDQLLYRSPGNAVPGEARVRTLQFAGQPWTLVERPAQASLPPGLPLLPLAVLGGGLVASGLLFAIAWSLSRTKARATELAESMTSELRARTLELETSNQALRQFSYVVTHDLKEPVRGIDVYLRILEEDHGRELRPETRTLLENARAASGRLIALLQALLELSRADLAALRPTPVDVALVARTEPCLGHYETLARERGAQVEIEEGPGVLAAPGVLAQALGNLIANGIRHNTSAAPRVRVRTERAGEQVDIVVEDNGAGFPASLLAAYSAGRVESRGFGLVLARQSVERLHGSLRLGASGALGGAEVRLTLPAAGAPGAAPGNGR